MTVPVCPGAAHLKGTPTLTLKACPLCSGSIEIFSTDRERTCPQCGFTVFNDTVSCRRWCRYAEKCFGEEAR